MKKKQVYIIRKYVVAGSCSEALKKDKITPVHDCWLEEISQKELFTALSGEKEKMGFNK